MGHVQYEGHWVKVKVTGAKKGKKNLYSCSVKLRSAVTPVRTVKHQVCIQHRVFGYADQCDRQLCHVIGSDRM